MTDQKVCLRVSYLISNPADFPHFSNTEHMKGDALISQETLLLTHQPIFDSGLGNCEISQMQHF